MHDILQQLGGIIGVAAYAFLILAILKSNVRQNFAAFMLWGMLDTIATITSILENGNFWLPLSNAVGASAVAVLLVIKKQVSWTRVETMTAFLVIICLIVWSTAGQRVALMATAAAVVIASIPQMFNTYKKPSETPLIPYFIFLAANVLSLFAGKSWSVEERLYPSASLLLTLAIVLLALRKPNWKI
ncbi:MAG: hypothetical protein HOP08_12675 [Cyclobacteriaceae bacterium]|nr:hypothetical protein [Cyclobacteriaceae bacterium]